MKLIGPLASGIAGASHGTVDVYSRGTLTRAKIYSNFIGSSVMTPTASLALDANGGRETYVNEYVDCTVKDSSGNIVRTFTAGETATDVEVNSVSFTGTDYVTGVAATSKPLALSTALDKLLTSFGEPDFNVLAGGTSKTMQAALSAISGLFFNVKDPTYGAVGDGVADDTSAIAAANTAAAGGGVLYFPPGTYRIVAGLTVGAKVSLMGAGPAASIITIDHASNVGITFSAATSVEPQFMSGLQVTAAQANSGIHVKLVTNIIKLRIDNCYIGGANTNGTGLSVAVTGSLCNVTSSVFEVKGSTAGHVVTVGAAGVNLVLCRFVVPATFNGSCVNLAQGGNVVLCFFNNSTATVGTFNDILSNGAATNGGGVIGCTFENAGGANVTAISSVGTGLFEACSKFGSSVTLYVPVASAAAAAHEGSASEVRNVRRGYLASDAGAVTITASYYGEHEIVRTTNGAQTVNFNAPLAANTDFVLAYNNNQGAGSGTITWGTNIQPAATTFTVNANKMSYYFFRALETASGNIYWVQYASAVNQTP